MSVKYKPHYYQPLVDNLNEGNPPGAEDIGEKFDASKPRWGLVPWRELESVVRVLTMGANKYSVDNWKKVVPTSRYADALMRHFSAWASGEKTDPESGESHMAHVICNALFLMWFDDKEKTP